MPIGVTPIALNDQLETNDDYIMRKGVNGEIHVFNITDNSFKFALF